MASQYESGGVDQYQQEETFFEWANNSIALPTPPKRCLQTIGIPDNIAQHFRNLDIETLKQMQPGDERYKEIPPRYHSAFYLDESITARGTGGSFGYPSALYKVIDSTDSNVYALRRVDNVRTSPQIIKSVISKWVDIRHPNIVSLHGIYQERGAVFFQYAHHPTAQSLRQRFVDQRGPLINEQLLWRILIQLISAVRVIHSRNMALRVINPIHILLTAGTVVRFNCVGIPDVIEFESRKTLHEMQIEDLVKLGQVMLALAARVPVSNSNIDEVLQVMQQNFTSDLYQIVAALLSGKASVTHISHLISDRIHDELDTAMLATDAFHSYLRCEYENSRLFRLLLKLGMINERPEYARAPRWSETGDRYVLKLFRDYVFHQTQGEGVPSVDAGHVLTALNKLDAGDPEKIVLSSRDNKDLLVVSFADVKRCLEGAFVELETQASEAIIPTNEPAVAPQSYDYNTTTSSYGAGSGGGRGSQYSNYQGQYL
jgi:PAB-dependent poly(A)-specific ribonuclease subunit 3